MVKTDILKDQIMKFMEELRLLKSKEAIHGDMQSIQSNEISEMRATIKKIEEELFLVVLQAVVLLFF